MSSLSELNLNSQLYKTQPQTVETLSADTVASNISPAPSTAIASGNSVTDVNTNSEQLNGAVIAPGTIPASTLDIANFGWTQTCTFSVVDLNTIQWGVGTFTSANGSSIYSIGTSNTGNMAAKTYVYLDITVSTTAYQTTTNQVTAIGIGKVLIAVCENGASSATYNLVQASQIVSDNILANTISAQKMNVSQPSAISADMGSITAGTITGATVQTAASGLRMVMDGAAQSYKFMNSSTLLSELTTMSIPDSGLSGAALIHGSGEILLGISGQGTGLGGRSIAMQNFDGSAYFGFFDLDNGSYLIDGNVPFNAIETDTIQATSSITSDDELISVGNFTYKTVVQPVIYFGYCSGTTISKDNNSFTLTNPSTGKYTITHDLSTTNYTVVATTLKGSGAGDHVCKIESLDSDSFKVTTFTANDGSVSASDFMFLLTKV